jgi:hypothetical protein
MQLSRELQELEDLRCEHVEEDLLEEERGQRKTCPPQMKPYKREPIVLQCSDSAGAHTIRFLRWSPSHPLRWHPRAACAPGCCPHPAPAAPSPPCTSYPNCPTCCTLIRPSSTSCATICRWLSQLGVSTRPVVASEVEQQGTGNRSRTCPWCHALLWQPYVAVEREYAS